MRNLKKILALVLALMMVLSVMVTASAATFADDGDIEHKEAVEVLTAAGVIRGVGNDSFDPDGILNRAQAATIIAYILEGSLDNISNLVDAVENPFTDVPAWAEPYVLYAYSQGVVVGTGNGKYSPNAELTGYAFGKMLLIAAGICESADFTPDDWEMTVATALKDNNLKAGLEDVSLKKGLSREHAAQMALNALLYSPTGTIYTVYGVEFTTLYDAIVFGKVANASFTAQIGTGVNDIHTSSAGDSLLNDVFGVDYAPNVQDNFGRPASMYYDMATGGYLFNVAFVDKPVYTTTEAVSGGALYTALGKPVVTTLSYYENGWNVTTVPNGFDIASGNGIYVGKAGQVTEVYKTGNYSYSIVTYNMWLGNIETWTEAQYDKDGDLVEHEKVTVNTGWSSLSTANETLYTYAFDETDVADGTKVYFTATRSQTGTWKVRSAAPAESVTGFMSAANVAYNAYTIGGQVYSKSGILTSNISSKVGSSGVYYLDANGYIIGTDGISYDPNYAILTQLALVNVHSDGSIGSYNGKYLEAELVFFDGTKQIVTLGYLKGASGNTYDAGDYNATYEVVDSTNPQSGEYSLTNLKNAYENAIVQYAVDAYGNYNVVELATTKANDVTLTAGVKFDGTNVASNNTKFVVRTGTGVYYDPYVYTVCTGFANLPAKSLAAGSADVVGLSTDGVSTYVYVTAQTVSTSAATSIAYIAGYGTYTYVSSTVQYWEYPAIVDGEVTTLKVAASATVNGSTAQPTVGNLYGITSVNNATGYVAALTTSNTDTIKTVAKNGIIELTTAGYKSYTDATVVNVIDQATGTISTANITSLTTSYTNVYVTYVKNANGSDSSVIATITAVKPAN